MHQFRSIVYLVIAIVNVIISIPLAKNFGSIGAAMGYGSIAYYRNGFIMNWYYQSKIGLDMKYFWINIINFLPALLLPVILGTLIYIYIDLYNLAVFLVSGFIYVMVFCTSMWYFGMNQYESGV